MCKSEPHIPVGALLLVLGAGACASPATFQGIGDLPGGLRSSQAEDVSHDGTRVAGGSHADDPSVAQDEDPHNYGQAAVWFAAGALPGPDRRTVPMFSVLRPLGYLLPCSAPETLARGISADGAVAVGYGKWRDPSTDFEHDQAFRWVHPDDYDHSWNAIHPSTWPGLGLLRLQSAFPGGWCNAEATNADGTQVFGRANFRLDGGDVVAACRWTAPRLGGTGQPELLLPGIELYFAESRVLDCSDDGLCVVGSGKRPGSSALVPLVAVPADPVGPVLVEVRDSAGREISGEALGVSADGDWVVGSWIQNDGTFRGFRWSRLNGQLQALPPLPGFVHSVAHAASGAGKRVVGYCSREAGTDADGLPIYESRATLWGPNGSPIEITNQVKLEGGTVPAEWRLLEAHSISKDGRVIVGHGERELPGGAGYHPEGWVVELSTP